MIFLYFALSSFATFFFICGIFDALSPNWKMILPNFPRRDLYKKELQDLALYSIASILGFLLVIFHYNSHMSTLN